jgi:predicted nucleotidyltransferase
MDKEQVISIAERFANEVIKKFTPDLIILFGSYAYGEPHDESDIDIAVIFNNFNGNFLTVSKWLNHLTWDISVDIEPILLDKNNDKSGFVEEIIKNGKVIYRHDDSNRKKNDFPNNFQL